MAYQIVKENAKDLATIFFLYFFWQLSACMYYLPSLSKYKIYYLVLLLSGLVCASFIQQLFMLILASMNANVWRILYLIVRIIFVPKVMLYN